MRLYKFFPSGHGQYSFFVCAETEAAAREAVTAHIMRNHYSNETTGALDYFAEGWYDGHYSCEVFDTLVVAENPND